MKHGFFRRQHRRRFLRQTAWGALSLAAFLRPSRAQDRRMWKAAVIGSTGHGNYGHGLDEIFQGRSQVEAVVLADPNAEGRAKTAAKIGALRSYADYRELLRVEKPALVSLAMRQADLHFPIARDALRAGAHLYCEKPFTTTPAEADELLGEAGRRGLKIAVAHTMRMTPALLRLKEALAEGWLGDLVEMRAYGKQDARAGGEDMMVLGTHLFDLMRQFAGDPLWCAARVLEQGRDIEASQGRLVRDNVGLVAGDEIWAQFAFPNGVNGSFTSAGKLRETTGHWGIMFYGSKGVARLNCDLEPHVFLRQTGTWKGDGKTDRWEPLNAAKLKSPPPPNLGPVGDWLEAVERDREPECSGRNGAWAVEMVMAVYQSALSGGRVSFPLKSRVHPLRAG
jgi:predicted dehydrogenase